jgi:hypothetical protein
MYNNNNNNDDNDDNNDKGILCEITLPVAQTVYTGQLQHYILLKQGLFQVCKCKYPA